MSAPAITFGKFYDTYSPMLSGIARRIFSSEKEGEKIMISTFKKMYRQNITDQIYPSISITLSIALIRAAVEETNEAKIKSDLPLEHSEAILCNS